MSTGKRVCLYGQLESPTLQEKLFKMHALSTLSLKQKTNDLPCCYYHSFRQTCFPSVWLHWQASLVRVEELVRYIKTVMGGGREQIAFTWARRSQKHSKHTSHRFPLKAEFQQSNFPLTCLDPWEKRRAGKPRAMVPTTWSSVPGLFLIHGKFNFSFILNLTSEFWKIRNKKIIHLYLYMVVYTRHIQQLYWLFPFVILSLPPSILHISLSLWLFVEFGKNGGQTVIKIRGWEERKMGTFVLSVSLFMTYTECPIYCHGILHDMASHEKTHMPKELW